MFKIEIFVLFTLFSIINCQPLLSNESILIIGGGASGITAAKQLHEKGFHDVKLYEAESRIGGRIKSVDWDNGYAELGAQWVYGNTFVYNLIEENQNQLKQSAALKTGLVFDDSESDRLSSSVADIVNEQLFGGVLTSQHFSECADTLNECIYSKYREIWQSEFGISMSSKDGVTMKRIFENFFCVMTPVDNIYNENGIGFSKFRDISRGEIYAWKNKNTSYSTFLDILLNKYPDPSQAIPIKIKLNKKVTKINWGGDDVIVETENGETITVNRVIVTVPLGVLKANYLTMFEPQLPQFKIDAIKNLNVATINKIILKFENRWWEENFSGNALGWTQADYSELTGDREWIRGLVGFVPVDNHPTTLTAYVYGKYAKQFESVSDEQFLVEIDNILRKFFNIIYPNYTSPVKFLRTKWFSEPNFQGAYSYHGLSAYNQNVTNEHLYRPLVNGNGKTNVYFAGEATHNNYFSTVHGAVLSGISVVNDMVESQ